MIADTVHRLFSYGTLQQPEVQRFAFGRELRGHRDAVTGHRVETVTIDDPEVVAASGSDRHSILVPDAAAPDVEGTVFDLSDEDLAAADAYEVDQYERRLVPLRGGGEAWVYVLA